MLPGRSASGARIYGPALPMKICPKCRKRGEFCKDASRPDGRSFYCKTCKSRAANVHNQTHGAQNAARSRSWRAKNWAKTLWVSAKKRARERGVPFSITVDDVIAAWPINGICPVLGIELQHGVGLGPTRSSPSLDAFIPARGYVPGNVHVISFLANAVKRDVTDPQVLEGVAAWIRSRQRP